MQREGRRQLARLRGYAGPGRAAVIGDGGTHRAPAHMGDLSTRPGLRFWSVVLCPATAQLSLSDRLELERNRHGPGH